LTRGQRNESILNWFRLRRLEGDLDRELQYHIDRRVTDLIHSGLPEPEARRRVALELGGATQLREEVRDIWLNRWLRDFVHDLRFSARSILRSPSFTATAVLPLRSELERPPPFTLSSIRSFCAPYRSTTRAPGSLRLEWRTVGGDLRQ